MFSVPLLLTRGAVWYYRSIQHLVSTDNAYFQQDKVSVSPQVTGEISEVLVRENQHVNAGEVVFRINPEPYRIAIAQNDAAIAAAQVKVIGLETDLASSGVDISGAREDVSFYQEEYRRQSELMQRGFTMAPRGIGVMCTSLFAGYMMRKFDFRAVIFVGYLIAAYSMWSMTSWSLDMGREPILIAAFVQGLGFGMIVSPMQIMAFSTLNPMLRPDGSSLMTLFRSFGGSIGISVIVAMLARNSQVSHADIASHVTATTIPAFDLPSVVDRMGGLAAK